MPKKELKQFPKVEFDLTPEQRQALASFADVVNRGFVAHDGTDNRCAVLGNIWLARGSRKVECFLVESAEYHIINRAILRARKQLK